MPRVECHSEFEPSPQEALLQSEILFPGAYYSHDRRDKTHSALDSGTRAYAVRCSGRSRPDIVSLSLQRVASHCQRVPPIFVDLLRREEDLSFEEYG
jgi:hypothetical protein